MFVGIDGGGTSTRCVVADETGEIVARGRAGGANAVSVPDPSVNLLAALRAALDGVDPARVAGGVFGLAGVASATEPAGRAWRAAGLMGRPVVVPDMLVAFTGTTAAPDGAVLVAGTGAVGARIRDRRVVRRADGLGWLLGDEGSGVWLGRQGLTAALTALDGRSDPTALVALIAAAVVPDAMPSPVPSSGPDAMSTPGPDSAGAGGPENLAAALTAAVYRRVAADGPAWLGTLAPVVDAAARAGDPVAAAIVGDAAGRLSRTAGAVTGADGRGGPLVLAGSLLTEPTELARLVQAHLVRSRPVGAGLSGGRGDDTAWVSARDGAAGAVALAVRAALPPGDPRAERAHRRLAGEAG
ncbi:N-acetylglucosamine kinase [Microbispora sp. RL4-1S]|uniref:N-acetylglucosamine kinase n=1 Tax=Microbispora oryzae TaxID=2806554 RepID=A0A941AIF1_9ACTN|nr:N-acetylglucosamine kinase [Microbispora oryzae]